GRADGPGAAAVRADAGGAATVPAASTAPRAPRATPDLRGIRASPHCGSPGLGDLDSRFDTTRAGAPPVRTPAEGNVPACDPQKQCSWANLCPEEGTSGAAAGCRAGVGQGPVKGRPAGGSAGAPAGVPCR